LLPGGSEHALFRPLRSAGEENLRGVDERSVIVLWLCPVFACTKASGSRRTRLVRQCRIAKVVPGRNGFVIAAALIAGRMYSRDSIAGSRIPEPPSKDRRDLQRVPKVRFSIRSPFGRLHRGRA
jgi:hypothetical protein